MFSTPSFSCLQCLGRDVRHLLCANCLAGVVERDQLDFGSPSPGILASAFPQLSQSCPRERESKKWTPRLQPAFSLSHLGERRNSFLKSLEWDLSLLQFNKKKKKNRKQPHPPCAAVLKLPTLIERILQPSCRKWLNTWLWRAGLLPGAFVLCSWWATWVERWKMWHRCKNTFYSPEKLKWGLAAKIKAQLGKKILHLFSCRTLNLTGFKMSCWKWFSYCIFCNSPSGWALGAPQPVQFLWSVFPLGAPLTAQCTSHRNICASLFLLPCSLSPSLLFVIFCKNYFLRSSRFELLDLCFLM